MGKTILETSNQTIKKIVVCILMVSLVLTGLQTDSLILHAQTTSYTTLYFVDDTQEQWISNDNAIIELVDNSNGHTSYIMDKTSSNQWQIQVPVSAYNITFNRYNSDKTTQWNSWSAGGRDSNNTYHAQGYEYGYWGSTEEEIVDQEMYYKEPGPEDIQWDSDTGLYYVKNQLLISALPGASKNVFEVILNEVEADIVGYIGLTNDYQIEFRDEKTLSELQNIGEYLDSFSFVSEVTLNTAMETGVDITTTNDAVYKNDDWNEEAPDGNNWGLEALHIPSAWDFRDRFQPVKMGLIDLMFDEQHEDLEFEQVFANPGSITSSHGTHVAGIMAAISDNGKGIAGVVTDCKLYGYATMGKIDNMQTVMMYKHAFASLVSKGVKVINVSMNTGHVPCFAASHGDESAINYVETNASILGNFLDKLILQGYDFVIVAAAGNVEDIWFHINESKPYGYEECKNTEPEKVRGKALAYYNSFLNAIQKENVKARIITVGAVGHTAAGNDTGKSTSFYYADFSNVGDRVDVCAPGVDIISSIPAGKSSTIAMWGYDKMSGTSMASPYISGLAGMLYQANPKLSGIQVKKLICSNLWEMVTDSYGNSYGMPDGEVCVEKAIELEGGNPGSVLPTGVITGMITNPEKIPIEGAKITAYRTSVGESNLEDYYRVATTDKNGNYELVLTQGTYNLNIYAEGYLPCVIENIVVNPGETIYLEDIIVVSGIVDSFLAELDGCATNALTGEKVEDVTVRLRKGWNNKSGKYVKNILWQPVAAKTGNTGEFSMSLPVGIYTVELEKEGFITGYFNVVSTRNQYSGVQTMTLTPVLSENEYRIVLTWGESPRDLDSHLSYYEEDKRMMHVYYGNRVGYVNGENIAKLDLDDTTSYGPETVTITLNTEQLNQGTFKYSVHDFTNRNSKNSTELSMSGAVVRVYRGNDLISTYYVPKNTEGTVWHVFEIKDNNIMQVNTFEYESNVSNIN